MARILDPLLASLEFSLMVVLKQTTFLPQQTTLASPISIRMENAWACQFLLEYTLLYPPLSEYILAYPVLLGYVRTVLTPMQRRGLLRGRAVVASISRGWRLMTSSRTERSSWWSFSFLADLVRRVP